MTPHARHLRLSEASPDGRHIRPPAVITVTAARRPFKPTTDFGGDVDGSVGAARAAGGPSSTDTTTASAATLPIPGTHTRAAVRSSRRSKPTS